MVGGGATFCITGYNKSLIFIGSDVLLTPKKTISVSRNNTWAVEKEIEKLRKEKDEQNKEIERLRSETRASFKDHSKSMSLSDIKSNEIQILDSSDIQRYEILS